MTTTLTKRSNGYKLWNERLTGETIEHGQVIQFYNAVYPLSQGYPAGGKTTSLTDDEAAELVEAYEDRVENGDGGCLIPEKGAARGREWLTKYAKRLQMPDVDYSTITHFRLYGVYVYDANQYRVSAAPQYSAHFADGSVLVYAPTPWQASSFGSAQQYPDWFWLKEGGR